MQRIVIIFMEMWHHPIVIDQNANNVENCGLTAFDVLLSPTTFMCLHAFLDSLIYGDVVGTVVGLL